jgi:2-desacetyl-2-hydroxyethyl bacteriochlorophyllide A dehydrogenase
MKQAILEGQKKFVVREVPDPVLDKDEVLIRVKYCGICGSDLHIFETGATIGAGHELSGEIAEKGTAVKGWKIGDRVIRGPRSMSYTACGGGCFWCSRGEIELCENCDVGLLEYKSGFATYVKGKYHQLYKLPRWLSYEEAALTEPTAVAVHAINQAKIQVGDVVAVLGMGPIGQLVARISGAKAIYATEKSQARIKLAEDVVDEVIDVNVVDPVSRILELTEGRGADVVFECSGSASASLQSTLLVRKGGTVVVVAICMDSFVFPFGTINLRELTIKGSMAWNIRDYATAFDLITGKKINVAPLVTTRIPLDDINEAFEKALRGEGGKIMIKP